MWKTFLNDMGVAFCLLTRIPLQPPEIAFERSKQAVWAYGIVGIVWALVVWSTCIITSTLGLSNPVSALLGLAAGTILTGAMHEDGLADSADGLWGGFEKERRLEIMRDSKIGVYGIIALFLTFLLRWQLLTHFFDLSLSLTALLVAGSFSRAVLGVIMVYLPFARSDGLSHGVGRPPKTPAYFGLTLTVLTAFLVMGLIGLAACVVGSMAAWACAATAKNKISGQTGDILGATVIITEIAIMTTIFSFLR